MNARNVAELAGGLRNAATEHREAANALVDALRARLKARTISTADSDRFRTAKAALSLLTALDRAPDDALVATLAAAETHTSDVAMGQSLTSAHSLAGALSSDGLQVFEKIDGLPEPYRRRDGRTPYRGSRGGRGRLRGNRGRRP